MQEVEVPENRPGVEQASVVVILIRSRVVAVIVPVVTAGVGEGAARITKTSRKREAKDEGVVAGVLGVAPSMIRSPVPRPITLRRKWRPRKEQKKGMMTPERSRRKS